MSPYIYSLQAPDATALDEVERSVAEVRQVYGLDAILHDWGPPKQTEENAYYFFVPKAAPDSASMILVWDKNSHFVKVRASIMDDPLLRQVLSDFSSALARLVE